MSFLYFPIIAKATTTVDLFQITTDGAQQRDALINDDIVIYTSYVGSDKGWIDIWGYDLRTKENFPIIEKDGQQFASSFYKDFIVYEDYQGDENEYDIWLYNLKTKEDKLMVGGKGSQTGPITNGRFIVYIDGYACGKLVALNIQEGTLKQISENVCSPVSVWQNTVVWAAAVPGGSDIFGYNLIKDETFNISSEDGQKIQPVIYGDNVAWIHYNGGGNEDLWSLKVKNLRKGTIETIYESTSNSFLRPAISDKYVVWSESSAQHVNGIKAAYLKTGEVFEVQPQGSHQNSHTVPAIWKNTAVWMSWRTGNGDIYGATFTK